MVNVHNDTEMEMIATNNPMSMKERTEKFVNVPAAEKSIYQLKQALQSQHRDHWKSYSEAMRSVDDR